MEMVKTKVVVKAACATAFVLCLGSCASSYTYRWHKIAVDNSRSGVTFATADNVEQAMGYVEDGVYHAPSGRVFTDGSTVAVASELIAVQPEMKYLKQVVAYAPKAMTSHAPQSELSNFAVDCLMAKTAEVTGRKVDVGITNFGGIRCGVPQGDVILDDFVSMFPFKNYLVYATIRGDRLLELFEGIVSRGFQAFGGVELVVRDRKILSFKIGGEEIDKDKLYGLASIDFLLKRGDGISIADYAQEVQVTDVLIRTAVLEEVFRRTEAGEPVEYHLDNRVTVLCEKGL